MDPSTIVTTVSVNDTDDDDDDCEIFVDGDDESHFDDRGVVLQHPSMANGQTKPPQEHGHDNDSDNDDEGNEPFLDEIFEEHAPSSGGASTVFGGSTVPRPSSVVSAADTTLTTVGSMADQSHHGDVAADLDLLMMGKEEGNALDGDGKAPMEEAFHDEIPQDAGQVTRGGGAMSLFPNAAALLWSSNQAGVEKKNEEEAQDALSGLLRTEPEWVIATPLPAGEDTFEDEVDDEDERPARNKTSRTKDKKNGKKGKNKKNKNGKNKKDKAVHAITYSDDEEIVARSNGDDDDNDGLERFEDEIADDGSGVMVGGTTTDAPPADDGADLEATAIGESSLDLVLVEKDENGVSLPPPDGLFAKRGSTSSSSRSQKKKKLARNASGRSSQTSSKSWRSLVMSSLSPLQATAPTPALEERQDRKKDAFEDEFVFGDSVHKDSVTSRYDHYDEDEESVAIKAYYDYDYERDVKPHYRTALLRSKWRTCCIVLCIFFSFIALIVPLSIYIKRDRQGGDVNSSSASTVNGNATTPPACVDEIRIVGDQTCFNTTTTIDIEFIQCFPDVDDWIGLFSPDSLFAGRLWENYYDWVWPCGQVQCTYEELTQNLPFKGGFTVPPLDVGSYQVFMVMESPWPYRPIAATVPFTVATSCSGDGPTAIPIWDLGGGTENPTGTLEPTAG